MNVSQIDAMGARLDRVEAANQALQRECRRWRRAGLGVFAGLTVWMLAGAKAIHELPTYEAGHFVLRDQEGRMRAALGIRPDGTPGLGFFDEHGKHRLSFDLGMNGAPSVNLYDHNGVLQAALASRINGTPGLGLFDRRGAARLSLDIRPEGSPGVNIFDEGGRLRAALAIRPDGMPGLGLFDETGNVRLSLDGQQGADVAPPAPLQ